MSSNTENLELFKYDPVADKDQTFNIELALNQNWDKVDKEIAQREGLLRSSAVKEGVSDTDAIAIVDDADSSKTKRVLWSTIKSALSKIYVPLTRKINSKSLSSDVTLTGADIQVSETDNTKIDAALSNKAEKIQPQVYNLELADGWTEHRQSVYFKTQEGIVTVYLQVHTDMPKSGEVSLATLPIGFRPGDLIGGSGYCSATGKGYIPADMKVSSNGNISGYNTVGEVEYYTGFFTFVADG